MKRFFLTINILHFLNDGFKASLMLFLPFLAKDLSIPLSQIGLLSGTTQTLQVLFSIIAGYIAVKIGGIKTILFAMLVYGISFIILGFSYNFFIVVISFVLAGIGFSALHPIGFALITSFAQPEQRGKMVGDFTAIGDIGIVAISSIVPFFIVHFGWHTSALVYGVLIFSIFALVSSFSWKKKENDVTKKEIEEEILAIPLRRNKRFLLAITASFLDAIISNPIYIFLPFLLLFRGIKPEILGFFMGSFFLGSLIGKTVLGRFVDKVGNLKTFIIAELCMAFLLVLAGITPSLLGLSIVSLFLGIVTRGTSPAVKTIVFDMIGAQKKVQKAFVIENVFNNTGSLIGPIILGFLSEKLGIANAFVYGSIFAAIATIPAIVLVIQAKEK